MNSYLNTTSFHRTSKTSNFTVIPNEIINDSRLNPEAFRIIIYILSKPDTWIVNQNQLMVALNIGKKICEKGMKCLVELGYIVKTRSRVNGDFSTNYEIYESAQINQISQSTSSTVLKEHIDNTESINTEKRYTLNEMKDKLKEIFLHYRYNAYKYTKQGVVILDIEMMEALKKLTNITKQEAFLHDIEIQVKEITEEAKKAFEQFSNEN